MPSCLVNVVSLLRIDLRVYIQFFICEAFIQWQLRAIRTLNSSWGQHGIVNTKVTESNTCIILSFFRSIKHYFLMDLGDFFVQFMDLAEDEMKKNMDGILLQHSFA